MSPSPSRHWPDRPKGLRAGHRGRSSRVWGLDSLCPLSSFPCRPTAAGRAGILPFPDTALWGGPFLFRLLRSSALHGPTTLFLKRHRIAPLRRTRTQRCLHKTNTSLSRSREATSTHPILPLPWSFPYPGRPRFSARVSPRTLSGIIRETSESKPVCRHNACRFPGAGSSAGGFASSDLPARPIRARGPQRLPSTERVK